MEDGEIKISVIVPVYNECREYLEDCVFSIYNQAYKNLEVILVDDGSSSNCCDLCDDIGKIDKRIKVIHKENGGSQSARRRGIEEATGDYVAFVDSDDWIELNLYEKMVKVIVKDQPDMVVASNYYRNYADGTVLNATDNKREGFWKDSDFEKEVFPFIKTETYFDTEFPIAMWPYLFKTKFARIITRKISDDIKTAEDYAFLMYSFLNAKSLSAISYRGYHYRSNANSKTHTITNVKKLLYSVYQLVNNAIAQSSYNQEMLKRKNRIVIFHALIVRNYKILFELEQNFLFPFSNVTKGSKILIYGAGKFGKEIYNAIKDDPDFEIIGIVDRNWKLFKEQGINVNSPEEVLKKKFDYVIIAITYVHVRRQIKQTLINVGVPGEKIAEIDMDVFDENHLPF